MIRLIYIPVLVLLLACVPSAGSGECLYPTSYKINVGSSRSVYLIASYHAGTHDAEACIDSSVSSAYRKSKAVYFELVPDDERTDTIASKKLLALSLPDGDRATYVGSVSSLIHEVEEKYGRSPRLLSLHPLLIRQLILAACPSNYHSKFGMDEALKQLALRLKMPVESLWMDFYMNLKLAREVSVHDWVKDTQAVASYALEGCQPSLSSVQKKVLEAYGKGDLEQSFVVARSECRTLGSCLVDDTITWAPRRTEALASAIVGLADVKPSIVILGASHVTEGSGLFASLRRAGAQITPVASE